MLFHLHAGFYCHIPASLVSRTVYIDFHWLFIWSCELSFWSFEAPLSSRVYVNFIKCNNSDITGSCDPTDCIEQKYCKWHRWHFLYNAVIKMQTWSYHFIGSFIYKGPHVTLMCRCAVDKPKHLATSIKDCGTRAVRLSAMWRREDAYILWQGWLRDRKRCLLHLFWMNDLTVRSGMRAQGGEVVWDRIGGPVGERGRQGVTDEMRCDRKAGEAAGALVGRSDVGKRGMNAAMLSQKGLGMCWSGHGENSPFQGMFYLYVRIKIPCWKKGGNLETGSEGLQRFSQNQEHWGWTVFL